MLSEYILNNVVSKICCNSYQRNKNICVNREKVSKNKKMSLSFYILESYLRSAFAENVGL